MATNYFPYYTTGHLTAVPPITPLAPLNCQLIVRQQPTEALVSLEGKEKTRKPIDPPPIIELKVVNTSDVGQQWLQSPYFFIVVDLLEDGVSKKREGTASGPLIGTLASSLHRLKDSDNKDGAFFIFPDISSVAQGTFRLRFSLFELQDTQSTAAYLGSVESAEFKVVAAKDFKGMAESTVLSRSFSDQGVRLRLRKEPRGLSGNKRKFDASAADEKENPHMPNMAGEPSSSFDESSSPNKRFKDESDDRKDSLPAGSYTHMPTATYTNPTSYTAHSSYAPIGHASSRYHNTLPEPSNAAFNNYGCNLNIQRARHYEQTVVGAQQTYQHQNAMASPTSLYNQQTYQSPINNGIMPGALPHYSSYNNTHPYSVAPPRRNQHEPMNYPSYPDNNDFGGQAHYPPSQ